MNEEILNMIRQDPRAQQVIQQVMADLRQDPDVDAESVQQVIRMIEFVLRDPNSYPDFLESAIGSGVFDQEDLPPQFDPQFLMVMLVAMKLIQRELESNPPAAFARGGLAQLAGMGRDGDTQLAHINPFEARLLRYYGGSGRINPNTGLPEYGLFKKLKKAVKKIFKAAAPLIPLALAFVPGLQGVAAGLGGALGASGTAASVLGNAIIGGVSSKLGGGSGTQGALLGGLTAGLGGTLGSGANEALGLGLGEAGQAALGGGLAGAVGGMASGQGALAGAAQGALGSYLGSQVQGIGGTGAVGQGVNTAGTAFGNMMASGYSPQQSLVGAGIAGIGSALTAPAPKSQYSLADNANFGGFGAKLPSPSDLALQAQAGAAGLPPMSTGAEYASTPYSMPQTGMSTDYSLTGGGAPSFKGQTEMNLGYELGNQGAGSQLGGVKSSPLNTLASQSPFARASMTDTTPSTKGFNLMSGMSNLLPALALFSTAKTPQQIQQATTQMSPEQRAYFDRALYTFDWDKLQEGARQAKMGLGEFVARNWNNVAQDTSQYAKQYGSIQQEAPAAMARGGALNRLARGGGSGRADTIPARLSDGEYVMDAETVALLGDGSTQAGANKLDEMRSQLRQQKGKALARGRFSPNAKSPLQYLKGEV